MKIRITLKDPDGVDLACDDFVESVLNEKGELDEEERELLGDHQRDKFKQLTKKFIEYGEYVTIEIDTDKGTAVVVPK